MTVVVDERKGLSPTLKTIGAGHPFNVEMYVNRRNVSDVPKEDEAEVSKYLMNMFMEKDALKEQYITNGKFDIPANFQTVKVEPSYKALLNTVFWNCLVLYFGHRLLLDISYLSYSYAFAIFTFIILLFMASLKIINSTDVHQSSTYGQSK